MRRSPRARFLVSDLILSELATRLKARAGAANTGRIVRGILQSRRYEVIYLDHELLLAALDELERFADKRLSLPDCASFAVMRRLALDAAFTFDRDFRDCGFSTVP